MGLDYLTKKHYVCDEELTSKIDVQSNLNQTMDKQQKMKQMYLAIVRLRFEIEILHGEMIKHIHAMRNIVEMHTQSKLILYILNWY